MATHFNEKTVAARVPDILFELDRLTIPTSGRTASSPTSDKSGGIA